MEYRSYTTAMEIRSLPERILAGIVVPFGVDKDIDGYLTERFERGAFRHQYKAAPRVALRNLHTGQFGSEQIGAGVMLRDDDDGLYGEFRVADSEIGRHYWAMARERMISQWSIGFRPEKTRRDGRVTVYTRAQLLETALVPEGAYGEAAQVASVRSAIPRLEVDRLRAQLPKPLFPA